MQDTTTTVSWTKQGRLSAAEAGGTCFTLVLNGIIQWDNHVAYRKIEGTDHWGWQHSTAGDGTDWHGDYGTRAAALAGLGAKVEQAAALQHAELTDEPPTPEDAAMLAHQAREAAKPEPTADMRDVLEQAQLLAADGKHDQVIILLSSLRQRLSRDTGYYSMADDGTEALRITREGGEWVVRTIHGTATYPHHQLILDPR